MGATPDHPTALRLKLYILEKYTASIFKFFTNTSEDPSVSCLISPLEKPETSACSHDQIRVDEDVILSGILNTYVDSDNFGNDNKNYSLVTSSQNMVLEFEKTYPPTNEEEELRMFFKWSYVASKY